MAKKLSLLSAVLMIAASMFLGCTASLDLNEPDPPPPAPGSGIKWSNDNGGTLEVFNGTNKDLILFAGKNIPEAKILGGVRSGSTKDFDVSFFSDFGTGGYVVVRGISLEEYESNKTNLSAAQIDYTDMVTYRSGTKYRHIIDASTVGDYGFIVNNNSPVGIELRKNSPQGEKIAYLPGLAQNQIVYASTQDYITLFPVYVYYNPGTQEITTLNTTTIRQSKSLTPEPLANAGSAALLSFPASLNDWYNIANDLKTPYAYISVTNGTDDGVRFREGTATALYSQSGYQGINSGKTLSYEVTATDIGVEKTYTIALWDLSIPVMAEVKEPDENGVLKVVGFEKPIIRNGYDYQVSVNQFTGDGSVAEHFKAIIVEVAKRDLLSELLAAQNKPQN